MLLKELSQAASQCLSSEHFAYEVLKLMYREIKSNKPVVYLPADQDNVIEFLKLLDNTMQNVETFIKEGGNICADAIQLEISKAQFLIARLSWYYN